MVLNLFKYFYIFSYYVVFFNFRLSLSKSSHPCDYRNHTSFLTEILFIRLTNSRQCGQERYLFNQFNKLTITASANELSQDYEAIFRGNSLFLKIPYGIVDAAYIKTDALQNQIKINGTIVENEKNTFDLRTATKVESIASDGTVLGEFNLILMQINPVMDTGQTICYSLSGTLVSCENTVHDGKFTSLPNARFYDSTPRIFPNFPSDYITKDRLKGLIWKACAEGQSGADCSTNIATDFNQTNAIAACNNLNSLNNGSGYAGKKNWRMPTIRELANLRNLGKTSAPYIDGNSFPNTPFFAGSEVQFWSSSTTPSNTNNAYVVTFNTGNITSSPKANTLNLKVRCVSSVEEPAMSLVDQGDGTILDERSELIWQKCAWGQTGLNCSGTASYVLNWETAQNNCANFNLNGKSWRIPSEFELSSIFDYTKFSPILNSTYFPAVPTGGFTFYSSSTILSSPTNLWSPNSDSGISTNGAKGGAGTSIHHRCVTQ